MALATCCLDCGTRGRGSRCPGCKARSEAPRKHASGRNSYQWQQLRELRKRIDGYRCTYCGGTDDLTVELDPRLQGNPWLATINDCVTRVPHV
jgi:5-methylcytosine-specific restriction endonuclease McrA